MINGTVAVAEAGGGDDGGVGVLLRRSEGFGHGLSLRETGGHRGGKGAAGAVRVLRVDPRAVEHLEDLAIVEEVGDGVAAPMPALDDDPARAERVEPSRRFAHLVQRVDWPADEHFRLRQIRGDDEREREQPRAESVDRVCREELIAALRYHHRVHDEVRQTRFGDHRGDGDDDRRRAEHPSLEGVHAEIANDALELRRDEGGREHLDALHANRVLRRHRCQDAHAIDAERAECFQVRLNAGPAARIGPGDRECSRDDRGGPLNGMRTG